MKETPIKICRHRGVFLTERLNGLGGLRKIDSIECPSKVKVTALFAYILGTIIAGIFSFSHGAAQFCTDQISQMPSPTLRLDASVLHPSREGERASGPLLCRTPQRQPIQSVVSQQTAILHSGGYIVGS